ncbi:MAG: putative glycoside hydrolase [Candidatus Paceibacterota bacterium]
MRLWQDNGATRVFAIMIGALLIVALGLLILWLLPKDRIDYSLGLENLETDSLTASVTDVLPAPFVVTHVSTPKAVKAVYMTSWAAGNQKFRKELFDLVDNTEINSVVIDVKDYSGRISFPMDNPEIKKSGAVEKRIPDIKEFIGKLHDKGVYVIARISSFQDSYLINVHPELAVRNGEGKIWQDYKGVKWLDAGAEPVWEYLVTIGKESYAVGFDELNFDYIRYPSDGNMKDIVYSWSDGRTRQEVMKSFFLYLREQFATSSIPLSADLFGLTTSSDDDLGIGQNLSDALMYFDYVSPMVYPSHFSSGYLNYTKPADHPYEVIKNSMDQGILKANAVMAPSSKIRPWLQAFDLGAVYTPAMVRAQIQATYDSGLDSWMLWNAGSVYNKKSLLGK